ncbi:MAG: hypothetical protein R3211_07870 [Balneolaceae bacterium]|nr:hypothetical protein [Balneolaceae bacterium]
MEALNGATIFWLISFGMLTGWIAYLVMGDRGVGIISNVAGGTIGMLVVGILVIVLGVPGSLVLALMGTVCILFVLNIFHVEPDHGPGGRVQPKE